ncbi:hypothetical protein CDL60_01715 [Roseateles noduli]|nr:hypothetical protein CDL60_01715 [Roseateles noduli]
MSLSLLPTRFPLTESRCDGFHVVELEGIPPHPYGTFPGPLPPEEIAKLEQLEKFGRQKNAFSIASWWRSVKPGAARPRGGCADRLDRGLGSEAAALLRAVPLCLLDTSDRQQVSDLRAYGSGILDLFDPTEAQTTFASLEPRLHAALKLAGPRAAALARLARWETEPGSSDRLNARARGADAVRRALAARGDGATLCVDIGASHDARSSDVALPPPDLLVSLDLAGGAATLHLGDARPLDPQAFRAAATCLNVELLAMDTIPKDRFPLAWMPDCVSGVILQMDPGHSDDAIVARHARALAAHAPPALERIVCVTASTADASGDAAPRGWSSDSIGLRRNTPRRPDAALDYFLPDRRDLAVRWWHRVCDRPAAEPLSRFLTLLHLRVEGLADQPNAAAMREEASARLGRLARTLAEAPELLDAWGAELVVDAPCVDAAVKLLRDLDLAIGTSARVDAEAPAGALLRMALLNAADRHVGLKVRSAENIEYGLGLQALIDFRLAEITRKTFAQTSRPNYRVIAGMRKPRRVFGIRRNRPEARPSADNWPPQMHEAANRIIGDEVRAGFPGVRELLSSPEGPIRRLADRLLEDPDYQMSRASDEAEFLKAEERAERVDATPEDLEQYEQAQARMLPAALTARQLALMDDWLDPLRRAFPTPRGA